MSHTFAGYAKNVKPRLLLPAISEEFAEVTSRTMSSPLATHNKSEKPPSSMFLTYIQKKKKKKPFIHLGTCAAGVGTESQGTSRTSY